MAVAATDINQLQVVAGRICLKTWNPNWCYLTPGSSFSGDNISSICISILSMLSSSTVKEHPADNDRYVKNCKNGKSPKETRWWFHDDKV